MAGNNKQTKNYPKRKNYNPPKPSEKSSQTPANEFCAYNATYNHFVSTGGFNIFDFYTPDQLVELAKDPMGHNKELRDLSLILYGLNGIYAYSVDYRTAMPTLDKVIVAHGKSKDKKRAHKEIMESVLRSIKDKELIRDALLKGMIEGVAFYYFETTSRPQSHNKFLSDMEVENTIEINDLGINASIIPLPTDYTRIVGRKNSNYVIAFNLDYFSEADGEGDEKKLRKYPKEIREAYRKYDKKTAGKNWVILDSDKTIVHKIRSKMEERYGRPLVLAAINDILYGDYFTKTKRNVLDEINNRIIYQTFPEGKDKGTSALTRQQQQNQHNAVKNAVMTKNNRGGISFFSVAAGTKIDSIESSNTDIFDDKYESNLNDKISLGLGFSASLINGVGSTSFAAQQQNLELAASEIFQWIDQITAELNKCISANIIKDKKNWVECRYLPITHVNKSSMVGYAKELYLQGKGSLSLWASACGISPDIFFALLDQELEDAIDEKYPVHQTSYTYSKNDTGGRPTTDNPSENTMKSRANNGNALPSPSDNK